MKKIIKIIISVIMVTALFAGCADTATSETAQEIVQTQSVTTEPTEEPSPTVEQEMTVKPGTPPADLLKEEYNPFSDVEFPESYTVYMAEYEDAIEFSLYYLHLTTTDSAEDVVTYMSNLLGDSAEESIAQNLSALEDEGIVNIHGTEVDAGLNADCEIEPVEQDGGDYECAEGFAISMVMSIDAEDAELYNELLLSNINFNSLTEISNYMDVTAYDMAGIKVNIYKDSTEAHIGCYIEDAEQVWNDMATDMPDNYSEEYSVFSFGTGELSTDICEDLSGGFIHIFQRLGKTDAALKDYVPVEKEPTLSSLGFLDFRELNANVCYKDADNEIGVYIYKDEWGEPQYEEDHEMVLFLMSIDDNAVMVRYYPSEDRYAIQIEIGEDAVKYEYYAGEDKYINEFGQDDLSDVKEFAEIVFNKPDTDSILQDSWVTFEQYIEENFEMNAAELFHLEYE